MNIYALSPVNKTAAIVTNQTGVSISDSLTDVEKRENIILRIKQIDGLIKEMKKSPLRDSLGKEKFYLCNQAAKLPKKYPAKIDLQKFVFDILKEDMPKVSYDRLIRRARERLDIANAEIVNK